MKPKHLPLVHFELDDAHEAYINNQGYSFIGLFLSIGSTIFVLYMTYKDI